MNKKYLFGMFVSGAMLAACTADDLNTAPVAQEFNPSAPVFTVSFDEGNDLQNRATWESGYRVGFGVGDLLSLYHGVESEDVVTNGFTGYENAIYEGTSDAQNAFKIQTKAMVKPGYAVMVYPAETTYTWRSWTAGPVVTVGAEQDDETKINTPYMSEILNIKEWTKETDFNKADENEYEGYGRDYKVVLKRAASILPLNLDYETIEIEGVDEGIDIKEIELVNTAAEKGNDNQFTTSAAVVATNTNINADKKVYTIWDKSSAIDLEADGYEGSLTLSTTDVHDNVATFTLLPVSEDFAFEGKVVVKTTYGNVTINADDLALVNPGYTADGKNGGKYLAVNLLAKMIKTSFTGPKNTTFAGEYIGTYVKDATLHFDLGDLNMHGHIKEDKDLMTVLKVYDALNKDKLTAKGKTPAKVTFILDGKKEDKKFYMTPATAQKLSELIDTYTGEDGTHYLTYALCSVAGEQCETIVLDNSAEGAKQEEIPHLAKGSLVQSKVVLTDETEVNVKMFGNIELKGAWTFADGEEEAVELYKMKTVTVLEDGELSLDGMTLDVANEMSGTNAFSIVNKGTVTVNNFVYLAEKLENFGTITINENAHLIITANATLTNREAIGEDVDGWSKGAKIYNHGELAVDQTAGNQTNIVENYGYIEVYDGSTLLITRNGDVGSGREANIKTLFGSNNRMGTIYLKSATACEGRMTIKEMNTAKNGENAEGFVKYESTIKPTCKYANYVIDSTPGNKKTLPTAKYAELKAGKYELMKGVVTYLGLVVYEDVEIYIGENGTLTPTYMFHNGYITAVGTLTNTYKPTGYYNETKGGGKITSETGGKD